MDWVSIWVGLLAIVGLLCLWRFVRREMAWVVDRRKESQESFKRISEMWDGMLAKLEKRMVRLGQVHTVALEMREWALPAVGDMISAVKVVEYSNRLLAITEEEIDDGSPEEESEGTDDGEEGAQGPA